MTARKKKKEEKNINQETSKDNYNTPVVDEEINHQKRDYEDTNYNKLNRQNRDDDYWRDIAEDGLEQLILGATVTTEKMDNQGCIHELHQKLPPNIDAIKFALKNRSQGKWSDKIEVSTTQVTFNLTASYNEVKELLERERQQSLIDKEDENIVDVIPLLEKEEQE